MKTIKSILRRLRSKDPEREVEEELRFHIEMRTRDNIAAGMTPEDAATDARRRFGNFDRLSAECREISREMRAGGVNMKAIKGITWTMLGCGLTLYLTSEIHTVRQAGSVLMWIAVLWRLLLYLRATQPDQHRINQHLRAAAQTPLNLDAPAATNCDSLPQPSGRQIGPHDKQGRTPVERLIAEDEPLP